MWNFLQKGCDRREYKRIVTGTMLLTTLKHSVKSDFDKVDRLIIDSLHSEVALVQNLGSYIIDSGGKRLRPLLVLLGSQACNYQGAHHITMAVVIEFIHTATLLHDDVVDNSMLRRGRETANNIWGNEAAVLVGDFLYSRAFQLMVGVQKLTILNIIADATNTIAEGEVLQLLHQRNPDTSLEQYLHVIRNKTAKLFESAAMLGAVLADSPIYIKNALAQFGLHLGTAYQLIDDILDYELVNDPLLGKTPGNDLAEGKPTMPLIYLLSNGTAEQQEFVSKSIAEPTAVDLPLMHKIITESGALQYTMQFAQREAALARQAISELPGSEYKDGLIDLISFVVERKH